jgi:hypothetical protein
MPIFFKSILKESFSIDWPFNSFDFAVNLRILCLYFFLISRFDSFRELRFKRVFLLFTFKFAFRLFFIDSFMILCEFTLLELKGPPQ